MADAKEETWEVVGAVKKGVVVPSAAPVRGAAHGGRGHKERGAFVGGRAQINKNAGDEREVSAKHPQRWRVEAALIRAEQAAEVNGGVAKGKGALRCVYEAICVDRVLPMCWAHLFGRFAPLPLPYPPPPPHQTRIPPQAPPPPPCPQPPPSLPFP